MEEVPTPSTSSTPPNSIDSQLGTPPNMPSPYISTDSDNGDFAELAAMSKKTKKHRKHYGRSSDDAKTSRRSRSSESESSLSDSIDCPIQTKIDWCEKTVSAIFFEHGHVFASDSLEIKGICREVLSSLGHSDRIAISGVTYVSMTKRELEACKELFATMTIRVYEERYVTQTPV